MSDWNVGEFLAENEGLDVTFVMGGMKVKARLREWLALDLVALGFDSRDPLVPWGCIQTSNGLRHISRGEYMRLVDEISAQGLKRRYVTFDSRLCFMDASGKVHRRPL